MKYLVCLFLIYGLGCEVQAMSKKVKTEVKSNVSTAPPVTTDAFSISWEKKKPENKIWTLFVYDLISTELFGSFDSAKDATRICPKYKSLSKEQKVTVWTEFISAVAYYESGWKPTSWMTEKTMGKDPITGKQVRSEGLLQLSYQDIQWAEYCKFDWSKDKKLGVDDPSKTIFDPFLNLDCGLRILASQIKSKGKVIVSNGVYWAVLKDGGKFQKIPQIIGMVSKTGLCN